MEGKELYNDDEELNPKSNKKEEEDSDDFGLPEIEGESEKTDDDLGDPFAEETWEEKKPEEENYSYNEDYTSDENADSTYAYSEENEDTNTADSDDEYRSSYYEEEYGRKKSPVGWIIAGIVILILIIVAVFWWINREPEPAPVKQPVVEQQPVVTEPEPEPEPVEPEPDPEPVKQAGVFEINQPDGRYHVIIASSIDKDLVMDYGKKLAQQGMTCNILAPLGNRKFHRLSVADYISLNDAAMKSDQLKSEFGDEVWVIRY